MKSVPQKERKKSPLSDQFRKRAVFFSRQPETFRERESRGLSTLCFQGNFKITIIATCVTCSFQGLLMCLLSVLAGVFSAVNHFIRAMRSAGEEGASHWWISQPSAGWRLQPCPVCAGGGRHVSTSQHCSAATYWTCEGLFNELQSL